MSTTTAKKTLPLYSKQQLNELFTKKERVWATLKNRKVYDVTDFLQKQPNGGKIIEEHKGQDVTQVIKDLDLQGKTTYSKDIMNDNNLIGYLATQQEVDKLLTNPDHVVEVEIEEEEKKGNADGVNPYSEGIFVDKLPEAETQLRIATNYERDFNKHKFLDLNKPLVWQLLNAKFDKDFYVDQIHRPRHYGKGSAPLFGVWWMEPLTKTNWYVIPITWWPVVAYFFVKSLMNMNSLGSIALFGVGMFVWTLIEYGLHRFLFHFDENLPNHSLFFTLHFLLHGCHHYLPMDKYRLVMPPTLFILLCYPFHKVVFAVLPYNWACAGFAGGMFGYTLYDMTHYFLHHKRLPSYMRKLKKYHLEHHYKNYELGFGVTSWFWDKVFGTYLDEKSPLSKMKYD
ncbi:Inositolphosphorylceramide-B hydroxylase [Hanseniaspora valbyensis NRRL Y-1626]|uniref:Ceramide very long chain fatty acid hydroxylase n=1 Tax=Hanseniaspora valbyensis NRRL Y-1626 TaxID=766949 RepID=A0A1B7TDH0_9ASCO|nr:Inositolphosphorylceramide-B hydroxylase [Hanseniaspora valbyensis NRRL Y-1626]